MGQFFNSPGSGYNDSLVPGVRSDTLEQRHFMSRVFGWMTVGLLITGIVALLVSENTKFVDSLAHGGFWIVMIAQFGLVIWFSAGLNLPLHSTIAGQAAPQTPCRKPALANSLRLLYVSATSLFITQSVKKLKNSITFDSRAIIRDK